MLNVDVIITGGDDDHHQLGQFETGLRVLSRVIRSAALVTWLTADQWRGLNGAGPLNCPAQAPVNAFTVVSH
jgi:hypothetical protein